MAELSLRRQVGLLLLIVVTGCSVVPRRPAPRAPVVEAPPARRVQPPPAEADRHRIALLVPLSGPNAGVGTSIANAAMMAVDDTGGQRIRVTTYDTGAGAAAAAQRALDEGARLIVGPLLAEDVRAVAPIAYQARVPVIAFSNDTSVAGEHVYLLGYAPEQAIGRVLDHVAAQGARSVAGLVPAGMYGQRASAALRQASGRADLRLAAVQTFERSPGAVLSAAARLGQTGPFDAVLLADTPRVAAGAVPVIRRNGGAKATLLGTELWNSDSALTSYAPLRGAYFATVSDALYRQLAVKYRARYGKTPYRFASMGYDAVLLVTKIAQDWGVREAFPEDWLRDPGGFTGIDGAFRFAARGIAERALEVRQIGATGVSVVSPAPAGFGR